jgi:hypothetical protein
MIVTKLQLPQQKCLEQVNNYRLQNAVLAKCYTNGQHDYEVRVQVAVQRQQCGFKGGSLELARFAPPADGV